MGATSQGIRERHVSRKLRIFLAAVAVMLPLDQITKWLVRDRLRENIDSVDVLPGFFQLVHVENSGAAFGFLNGKSWAMYVFIPFTLVAGGILISMLKDLEDDERFMPLSLGLILAGAIGNFIDRVLFQSVTDFLRVYSNNPELNAWMLEQLGRSAEWPSFNVADIAVVVGVFLFLIHEIFFRKKEEEPTEDEAAQAAEA